MIEIDGSSGEGGGQMLRSALALSAVTGRPFRMFSVRARRDKPGLRPQHLESVLAVAQVCGARIAGAEIGSQELVFEPGPPVAGEYRFEIKTAGSTGLLLHAVYLPLAFAGARSRVTIVGGTHVNWSPSYHYLAWQWAPALAGAGLRVRLWLERCGFYPAGGGEIMAEIDPWDAPAAVRLVERGKLKRVRGVSAAPNLSESIARRQAKAVLSRLAPKRYGTEVAIESPPSRNRGTFVALMAEYEAGGACCVELGEIGRSAEKVGDAAARAVVEFDAAGGAVDEHLADQLLLPLSLIEGESCYTTARVTRHLLTNADVIRLFVDAEISVEGEEGEDGLVRVAGRRPGTAAR